MFRRDTFLESAQDSSFVTPHILRTRKIHFPTHHVSGIRARFEFCRATFLARTQHARFSETRF
jgi:hypothetical protein